MASARIKLDPQTVEEIARRVVALLERRGLGKRELVDAAELARRFGIERSWVYTHAIELGAIKLGNGASPGFGSTPRSPHGCCGGLTASRWLTRPPAQVSGRVSHRVERLATFGCCRSESKGRRALPQALR